MKWTLWCSTSGADPAFQVWLARNVSFGTDSAMQSALHKRAPTPTRTNCQPPDIRLHRNPEGCAAPSQVPRRGNTRRDLSKITLTLPLSKIRVTRKPPVGDGPVATLSRTDAALDHGQNAGKVSSDPDWSYASECHTGKSRVFSLRKKHLKKVDTPLHHQSQTHIRTMHMNVVGSRS